MGIGKLRCHVIDVNDLEVAEAFWSEVTGLPVIRSGWTGRFSYLGQTNPPRHELILQLVTTPKDPPPNRSHVDIWVRDVDDAINQIEAIGGTVKKEPSLYPRPGSFEGESPVIDWAVMQDPFGNEFCLVSVLSAEEVASVLEAAKKGVAVTDRDWRTAAGRTHVNPRSRRPGAGDPDADHRTRSLGLSRRHQPGKKKPKSKCEQQLSTPVSASMKQERWQQAPELNSGRRGFYSNSNPSPRRVL